MKTIRIKKPKLSKVLNLGKVQMAAKQLVVSTMMVSMVAMPYSTQAGFLDEYVEGASINTSQPGYVQSSSLNVISGGGIVAKFQNKGFTPFTYSPPSLKAGCGGIDLYLGAFGFPTKDEMVAFLRQVGQAAGGIAFQIALKALSPQLSSTIQDFAQQITAMTNNFRDSCSAARSLYQTGPGMATAEAIYDAGRTVRRFFADETAIEAENRSWSKVSTSLIGPNAASSIGGRVDPATGQAMPKPVERNITWNALNAGIVNQEEFLGGAFNPAKMIVYNMVGSVVYLKDKAPAPSASELDSEGKPINPSLAEGGGLTPVPYKAGLSAQEGVSLLMYGTDFSTFATVTGDVRPKLYICVQEDSACLRPRETALNDFITQAGVNKGLQGIFNDAAKTVIDGIRTRTQSPNFAKSVAILGGGSEFDLVKAVNLAGSIKYGALANNLVDNLVTLAAKNTAGRFIESAIDAAQAEIKTSKDALDSGSSIKPWEGVQQRITEIRLAVAADRDSTRQYLTNIMSQASYLRDIERGITSDLNIQLAQNLNFQNQR